MNPILILGGAKCVWDDIKSLGEWQHPVASVNDVGSKWEGPLLFWASLHPRKFKYWEKWRKDAGYPEGYTKWSNKYTTPGVDHVTADWGGSSGLFAVKIALELGFDKIIIAGIPMESSGCHYFDKRAWVACGQYKQGWTKHLKEIAPYVRSCSGWTKALLGGPEGLI